MEVRPIKTRVFKENEDLMRFVVAHIPKLKEGSILAVTSKIVALAEGRTANVRNKKEKEALIKKESDWALQTHPEWGWTEKDGALLVNAGIDDSNANGKLVLLPRDSFASAQNLHSSILSYYAKASKDKQKNKIRKLGIIITDSRISPMRAGVTGIALG